jgi:S-adenosylmethionine hydrolase
MKGVILGINPQARIVDLTHAVPPQQILIGALVLRSAVPFFPPGTVHVAVVDPGVGSARQPILVGSQTGVLVGPDNGLLSLAAAPAQPRSIRRIENPEFFRHPVSQTFHGRDVFAPVAAHLSRGIEPGRFGPLIDGMLDLTVPRVVHTPAGLAGEVLYVDHVGNLVTNIEVDAIARFPAPALSVSIQGVRIAGPVSAYAAAPEGTPLAIVGSWGMMEIAVCNGSAAQMFAAGPGTPVTVVVESRQA